MTRKTLQKDIFMAELIKNVETKTTILIAQANGEFVRVTAERLKEKPKGPQQEIVWFDEDAGVPVKIY